MTPVPQLVRPFSPTLRYRPLLAALLSAGVTLTLHLPLHGAEAPASAPAKTYAIGGAPLAEVLNRYAADAGVVLVFDADLLKGKQSKGLQGKFEVAAGFRALLAESGLEAVMGRSGGYVLRERRAPGAARGDPAPPATPGAATRPPGAPVGAREDQAPPAKPDADTRPQAALGAITVQASDLSTVERLDREMIVNLPAINGDMTSQLKLNPNIQYNESVLSSLTGGEIAPAEISIHGAKPYQNEMLLDGVSIANDLDPGNKIVTDSPDFIPGSAQALAVDSSILCDIEVMDSNVSAEYGRFTGGVVKSKICSARKRFGGNVSVGYSSSDWSTLFVDPARQQEFDQSSNADYQPRFRKWTYRATLEGRPSDEWGVLLSVVRRKSEIPLKRFTTANDGSGESREVTQKREQDTVVLKTDYTPIGSRHKAEATLVYAPSSNSYFRENYRNSDYTIRTGGLNLGGRLESRYGPATLTQQLSYSQNEQSRRSDADYDRPWRWSTDKNWADPAASTNPLSGEGAWGDIDQLSKSYEYKLRSAFTPFNVGPTAHRVVAGAEVRRQDARYERLQDHYQYLTVANLPTRGAIASCTRADGTVDIDGCSSTPTLRQGVGQYFTNLTTYHAGSFTVDNTSTSAYLEDEVRWRGLSLRAGVRADKDTLAGDTNLAPRLKLGWQAADTVFLDVGANRYYGRNLFAYAMQEKVNTLKTVQRRSGTLTWGAGTASKPLNRLEDVRSPHDDELTAGLSFDPEWLAGPLSVRMTRREGKDQIVKLLQTRQADCNSNQCYIYTNNGASVTKDFTISWSNARAFKIGNMVHRTWVAFNKSDVESNYSTYADTYGSSLLADELIRYDGKIIRSSEIPADNYNRPWTLRLGAMSTLVAQHLTVSNILRIRSGYEARLRNGTFDYQGASILNYEQTSLPRSTAIDTVVHWNPRVYRDQRLDVKLTIENLTNRRNMISVGDVYATYERGRTFALEIGYAF